MSPETSLLVGEITKRGYAEFEHGIASDQIDELVETYATFANEYPNPDPSTMDAMLPATNPDLHKQLDDLDRSKDTETEWNKYRTNTEGIGKPNGYTNRDYQNAVLQAKRAIDLGEDPKEYYHFNPTHIHDMRDNHERYGWGKIPPEVIDLDAAFRPIHRSASDLMTKICARIEEVHPGTNKIITPESLLTSPIRLLFYHHGGGEQRGAAHYDKGFATLQLTESHEGLRVATGTEDPLQPVIRDGDKAVFFAAYALGGKQNGRFPGSPFQPGWHDIVKSDVLNEGRHIPQNAASVCARYAIIFFANPHDYRNPDKSAMHSR